jgi:hypothetical protein
MGSFFQKAVGAIFTGFVLVILAGFVSDFLNELARDKGWTDNPSQKWDAGIAAFKAFVTGTWFLCAASALGGLTVGLWSRRHKVPSPGALAETKALLERAAELKSAQARRALAKALSDLHAGGVKLRNSVKYGAGDGLDDCFDEEGLFKEWNDKVLSVLDNDNITVRESDNFRTLDRFIPSVEPQQGRSVGLTHLEAMWNEKLDRLRKIIDRVGG